MYLTIHLKKTYSNFNLHYLLHTARGQWTQNRYWARVNIKRFAHLQYDKVAKNFYDAVDIWEDIGTGNNNFFKKNK